MIRTALQDLHKWKAKEDHKPLIIRGARQVGKTWLMKAFGKEAYAQTIYFNFDTNERLKNIFEADLDIARIIDGLQLEAGVSIDPENTLLIFDEIQEVPRALTSLKYFNENAPQYDIVAAGSLLGVAMHPGTSFPVGKVEFLDLYPLSIIEFMKACGQEKLCELLERRDWSLVTVYKNTFLDLLKKYYFIGGMPEAVLTYINKGNFPEVREVQLRILDAYELDFSKHAPTAIVPRINLLWNAVLGQLAKENRKFIYGVVKEGARAKDYELAMAWLIDCGLIHKVNRVTKPGVPLKAYEDFSAFKLFLVDVGLLSAMGGLDAKTLLEGSNIFEEFKGALTEQFVLQQLLTIDRHNIYYWSAERSNGEIDFLLQYMNQIIPVEVKAAENLQAKSLRAFCQKYNPSTAFRISMSDYREEDWLTNIPLYAISQWQHFVKF